MNTDIVIYASVERGSDNETIFRIINTARKWLKAVGLTEIRVYELPNEVNPNQLDLFRVNKTEHISETLKRMGYET